MKSYANQKVGFFPIGLFDWDEVGRLINGETFTEESFKETAEKLGGQKHGAEYVDIDMFVSMCNGEKADIENNWIAHVEIVPAKE